MQYRPGVGTVSFPSWYVIPPAKWLCLALTDQSFITRRKFNSKAVSSLSNVLQLCFTLSEVMYLFVDLVLGLWRFRSCFPLQNHSWPFTVPSNRYFYQSVTIGITFLISRKIEMKIFLRKSEGINKPFEPINYRNGPFEMPVIADTSGCLLCFILTEFISHSVYNVNKNN